MVASVSTEGRERGLYNLACIQLRVLMILSPCSLLTNNLVTQATHETQPYFRSCFQSQDGIEAKAVEVVVVVCGESSPSAAMAG